MVEQSSELPGECRGKSCEEADEGGQFGLATGAMLCDGRIRGKGFHLILLGEISTLGCFIPCVDERSARVVGCVELYEMGCIDQYKVTVWFFFAL